MAVRGDGGIESVERQCQKRSGRTEGGASPERYGQAEAGREKDRREARGEHHRIFFTGVGCQPLRAESKCIALQPGRRISRGGDCEQQQRKRGEHLGEWGMHRFHAEVAGFEIAVAGGDFDRLVGGNGFLHSRANLHDREVSEEGKDQGPKETDGSQDWETRPGVY